MNRLLINTIFVLMFLIISYSNLFSEYIPTDSLQILLVKENNLNKKAKILNDIAWNYLNTIPDSAKVYLNKALDLSESINDEKNIARTLVNFAFYYAQAGDYQSSGLYLTNARKIAEPRKDLENLGRIYAAIATNYDLISLSFKSREYFQKCYDINVKLRKDYNIGICLLGICGSYINEKRYSYAMDYLNKASSYVSKYHFTPLGFNYYMCNVMILKANDDIGAAFKFLDTAKSIADATNNVFAKIECRIEFANLNFIKSKYNNSIKWAKEAYKLASANKYYYGIMNSSKSLSRAYEKLGEFELSNKFLWEFEELRDSIFNESIINKIQIIQSQYEFDTSQTTIQTKDFDNRQKTNLLSEKQKLIYILIAFSVIGITLTYMLLKSYRKLKRYSFELNTKNQKITDISIELERQNIELEQTNSTKDKFFQIIGHDLRNPIGGIRNLADLLLNPNYVLNTKEINEITHSIYKASNNSYELLENLLQWAKAQSGSLTLHLEDVEVDKLIKRNCDLIKHTCFNKGITMEYSTSSLNCRADRNLLDTVIRNICSNAVKFSKTGDTISIDVREIEENNDKFIEISIKDSGVGMSKEQIENIFKPGLAKVTVGTNNESGSGLGLILCKEFVEGMGGRIWVESEEGKGSNFFFNLPLL